MKHFLPTSTVLVLLTLFISLTFGCKDQIVESSETASAELTLDASESSELDALSKNSPPSSATVQFGRNDIGSPFPPPEMHDASTHAKDALQPRTVVISAGGEVTFQVAAFHKIAIYDDGTQPKDIDVTLLEPSGLPEFPPIINDPTNRIVRGDLSPPGPDVPFSWTFNEPGRYLVICEVLPHFSENDMYGWVIVK